MSSIQNVQDIMNLINHNYLGVAYLYGDTLEFDLLGSHFIREVLGTEDPFMSITLESFLLRYVHPDEYMCSKISFSTAIKEHTPLQMKLRLYNKVKKVFIDVFYNGFFSKELDILQGILSVFDSSSYFIQSQKLLSSREERTQIMLDSAPFACNFWDDGLNLIDCNEAAVRLFGLKDKDDYIRNFNKLVPALQENGKDSKEFFHELLPQLKEEKRLDFFWLYQDINGTPIPARVNLFYIEKDHTKFIIGYVHDMREKLSNQVKLKLAEERTQLMLDANPISCVLWDKNLKKIDCNQAVVRLFDLASKEEFLSSEKSFFPPFQPNGRESEPYSKEFIQKVFTEVTELRQKWVHCKLNGELITTEVYLKRVKLNDEDVVLSYLQDLREITAMQSRMREAEERMQLMLDATPLTCTYWDKNINPIDCNEEAVRLFRVKDKEEYLNSFFDFSPEFQPDGVKSLDIARQKIEEAFEQGYLCFEWVHITKDNEIIPAEIILRRVKKGDDYFVISYTRDLRELKATKEKARIAEERMQVMFNIAPIGCTFWDKNFQLVDCNQECVRIFCLKNKQEFIDKFYEFSPKLQPNGDNSRETIRKYMEYALETGYYRFEWIHQTLEGEVIPCEITFFRVSIDNDYSLTAYMRDLRELKTMLGEIRQTEEELRIALQVAEKNAKAKTDFLANMSHEIRTPMNAVLGLLHLLAKTDLNQKQADYVQKTEQSASLLLRIINDILDFSKIEAGQLDIEKIEFSLPQLIISLRSLLQNQLSTKSISFNVDIADDTPDMLIGDPLRVEQILLNLLSNAIKFTHQGRIDLSIKVQKMEENFVLLFFQVKDQGIGMSLKQVNTLFSPFTQADSSITRKYGGTGLGLSICKNLVDLMEGNIWCDSIEGEGSTFSFYAKFGLPEKVVAPVVELPLSPDEIDYLILNGLYVLVAEDNDINQLIIEELLLSKGVKVDMASNGIEAIEMLKQNDYDIVFMDIQMPEMDGLTATKIIRQNPKYASLPIIAMTAHAMTGAKEVSLENGMNDHLTKPIELDKLYAALKLWGKR